MEAAGQGVVMTGVDCPVTEGCGRETEMEAAGQGVVMTGVDCPVTEGCGRETEASQADLQPSKPLWKCPCSSLILLEFQPVFKNIYLTCMYLILYSCTAHGGIFLYHRGLHTTVKKMNLPLVLLLVVTVTSVSVSVTLTLTVTELVLI